MSLTKTQKRDLMDLVEVTFGRRKANLTVQEFAQITGYHPDNVRKDCMSGALPAHQSMKWSPYLIYYGHLADYVEMGAAA